MQERTTSGHSGAIPCGRDALEEFSPDFSSNQAKTDLLIDALGDISQSDRNRAYSLSTDDEFCMVDEDVIGSGITDLLFRYLIRDISISLHLYGGSDLSEDPPKERSYSTSEYREGKGRNQVVLPDAFGGKHRDHSVCVVLELNKISCVYQLFNKDAPLMSMKLFTIHNITLLDKLTASQIKEMMYQVSMLPIKFNIDQDTMEFLDDFFQEVRASVELPSEVSDAIASRPILEVPATVHSSADEPSMESSHIYPSLERGVSLNMDVLTPAAAPSPICEYFCSDDLSYLEHRSHTESPVKRPIADAPLTASAVSIGDLFGTKSRASQRISPVEEASSQSSSPDLVRAAISIEEETSPSDDLHLAGDWSSSSEIRFPDLDPPTTSASIDKMLMGASMHDSFHPDMVVPDEDISPSALLTEELVDTSSDIAECSNDADRSTICDEEASTQMAGSSFERQYTPEPQETTRGSTFFKEFIFSPPVSIYVDYHGKNKINVEKNGPVLGVLTGIGQLNRTEFVLKEIVNRNGLLGVAVDEWIADIRSNLPNVLASCGPISPFVQIGKGVMDLFWLPVAELRKEDGHVVKGIQKGVGSFGLSSAAGVVGMAQTVVGVIQMLAESVLREVQPSAPYLNERNRKGVMDLFWLPVAELRKEDGHVVKGIQKGVGSFGLSSAAGVVGMAQTVVGVIQVAALRIYEYKFPGYICHCVSKIFSNVPDAC
ncbi:hypothetical protein NECAME_06869 [Necator americanus]|uniref:Autophagy-related protein 2 n=1 Tax=Necator americanus TaxID=51031 RepID=W2TTN7_NECAM|nr:hypothetical protein NECAME_06869 [Necator americanus]ETN84466.1 hypothetical protein NECAME_06869 [Necator americanus]